MASRNTLREAQELKAQIEKQHPAAKIVIVESSSERRIGRRIAGNEGFEIIEDDGGIMVTVKETRFDVLEARTCQSCGNEYTTVAIGEADDGRCPGCREKAQARWRKELAERVKAEEERVRELEWRNEIEE
jgi:DNA-directed RNA polymerase subunit RPC12/RpoP